MNDVVIALDTSNYTSSFAIISSKGELIANLKKPLSVAQGQRGLRQSDAVFSHIKNIPLIMNEAKEYLSGKRIVAVGVSSRPRNVEGSYMPCFLAGVSSAESISAALGVPIFRFSHQCGHIMAAVYSSGNLDLLKKGFAAFHISGGTTELLKINSYSESGFSAELVGGTKDLNAGQVIDRIGVYMGLDFPCGPKMEELALENTEKIPNKKISLAGLEINLSGAENIARKLFDDTQDKAFTSAFVFDYISNSIISLSRAYEDIYGKTCFVYAGGVMSNSIIKSKLAENFNAYFAEPSMSSDNAVGIAYLTLQASKSSL